MVLLHRMGGDAGVLEPPILDPLIALADLVAMNEPLAVRGGERARHESRP